MYLSQCCITHFASDTASIFRQFMGMTAPKRRGMREIPHPHAAHLPYLPELRQRLWQFCMSISGSVIFRGGGGRVVSICYYNTHAGPAAWNALPDHIRTVADPVKFRKLLKSHYFSKAFNICWYFAIFSWCFNIWLTFVTHLLVVGAL